MAEAATDESHPGDAGQFAATPRVRPLPARVSELVLPHAAGEPILHVVESRTRVDTGGWGLGARLWLCCLADRVVIAAVGREPMVKVFDKASLGGTFYNHITGELVLASKDAVPFASLKMPPTYRYAGRTIEEIVPGRIDPNVAPSADAAEAELSDSSQESQHV